MADRIRKEILLFFFIFTALCHSVAQTMGTGLQPNIILILADDLGYDDIGCFGSGDIRTPHLDQLAAGGARFTGYYAPHGSGEASRAAILTGRYAPRLNHGKGLPASTPDSQSGLDPATEITLSRLLKTKGYATGMIGSWQLGHRAGFLPVNHGFDHFLGIPYSHDLGPERRGGTGSLEYPEIPLIRDTLTVKHCTSQDLAGLPALFRREACRFIRDAVRQDKPFYLFYSSVETHIPWFVPPGFDEAGPAGPFSNAVMYLDQTVGAILTTVKELGIERNTIIVFSSGNGPQISRCEELEASYGKYARVDTTRTRQFRGGKGQSRYEGGTRVPCILSWPGTVPGKTKISAITSGLDLLPTFTTAAGVALPAGRIVDGKDLLPLLTGRQKDPPHLLFFGFEPDGMLMSIRYKNWKLAVPSRPSPGAAELGEYELYQLDTDPQERVDVSAKFPEIVDQLRQFGEKARIAIRDSTRMPQKNFIE